MPSAVLESTLTRNGPETSGNPLLVKLGSSLAMVEIQGEIHTSTHANIDAFFHRNFTEPALKKARLEVEGAESEDETLEIGKLVVDTSAENLENSKAEIYIGRNQKLIGEVQKLSVPLAVLDMGSYEDTEKAYSNANCPDSHTASVQVTEVIRHRILFNARPVPSDLKRK